MPLERRTLAIFLIAEFGFLGVVVVTLMQTPRLNGLPSGNGKGRPASKLNPRSKAGVLDL